MNSASEVLAWDIFGLYRTAQVVSTEIFRGLNKTRFVSGFITVYRRLKLTVVAAVLC